MGEVCCNFEQNQTKAIKVIELKPIPQVYTISNNTSYYKNYKEALLL